MYISPQRIGEYARDISSVPDLKSTLESEQKWQAAKIFPQYDESTQMIIRGVLLEDEIPYSLSTIKCSHVKLVRDQLLNWIANSQCELQSLLHPAEAITSRAMITLGPDHVPVHPYNTPSFVDELSKYLGFFLEESGGSDTSQERWALKSELSLQKVGLFIPDDGALFLPDMRMLPAVQCFVDDKEQFTHAITLSVIDYVQHSLQWQLSLKPCLRLKKGEDAYASDEQLRAALEVLAKLKSQNEVPK